jgi:predicted nucleic acid-binding protein
MKVFFADTFYFLALLSERDLAHSKAIKFSQGKIKLVTTAWILTEIADALSHRSRKFLFLNLWEILETSPDAEVILPSRELFDQGIRLYSQREDKDWSLTNCISFVAMRERGISEALTGDHHFEQAGFVPLLK